MKKIISFVGCFFIFTLFRLVVPKSVFATTLIKNISPVGMTYLFVLFLILLIFLFFLIKLLIILIKFFLVAKIKDDRARLKYKLINTVKRVVFCLLLFVFIILFFKILDLSSSKDLGIFYEYNTGSCYSPMCWMGNTKKKVVDKTITVKSNMKSENIYQDEVNGFEFIKPTEKINFNIGVTDVVGYQVWTSCCSYNKYFYNQKENSWYVSDYSLNQDDSTATKYILGSTKKTCDNKVVINNQTFYFNDIGDEGIAEMDYFTLLNNGKQISFTTSWDAKSNPSGESDFEKTKNEIVEALKTFKTLGEVKVINTADCK